FGNIWTGRQGGDNVIAGHAYGWNNGSIGIAALGDYSIAQPTSALQGAIANIVAIKATQLGIQPYGNDTFTHQEQAPDGSWVNITSNPPNVQGHRDCNYILSQHGGQTACPGNGIYNMIDGLRRLAQNAVNAGYFDMPYIDPQLPKAGFPGAVVSVPVTVTNRGQTAIPAGTNVSYRILSKGAVVQAQGPLAPIPAPLAPGRDGERRVQRARDRVVHRALGSPDRHAVVEHAEGHAGARPVVQLGRLERGLGQGQRADRVGRGRDEADHRHRAERRRPRVARGRREPRAPRLQVGLQRDRQHLPGRDARGAPRRRAARPVGDAHVPDDRADLSDAVHELPRPLQGERVRVLGQGRRARRHAHGRLARLQGRVPGP